MSLLLLKDNFFEKSTLIDNQLGKKLDRWRIGLVENRIGRELGWQGDWTGRKFD